MACDFSVLLISAFSLLYVFSIPMCLSSPVIQGLALAQAFSFLSSFFSQLSNSLFGADILANINVWSLLV